MVEIIENDIEYILVANQNHLQELLEQINSLKPFAFKFKFPDKSLFETLLRSLEISSDEFIEKCYYYSSHKKIHISISERDYIWISTAGLVANGTTTKNRAVNSCLSQHFVLSLLFEQAIKLNKDKSVYDMDSYSSEQLTILSPAIYHNLAFYIEVFCKAYLSITKTKFPFTHNLPLLYKKTIEIMNSNKHNNSLFQILVLDRMSNFIEHISDMPKDFKEHNIKYNANHSDDSVILFDYNILIEMKNTIDLSIDFIIEYYYMGDNAYYLQTNVYQKMLDKADTDDKRKRIKELYSHLINI